MWKLGVQNEILSLIRDINKKCNIIVKTPIGLTEEFTMENIVQQGSVCGGILCSASTGEVNSEIKLGGSQIGNCNIKCLVYVDDIITVNNTPQDVGYSHSRVTWFSEKKRLTLNGPKCLLLAVNLKPYDVIPRLVIDGTVLESKETAPYLGDIFNSKGTNIDLINDRVKKGKTCIISSMSLCSDITMGIYAVETLLMLHKSLFIQVVLYNSQAWSNLTKADIKSLQTVQLKYLKRVFFAPSSTSNPLTFLETGILPIQYLIHARQLTFLHHILSLQDNDPVKRAYQQQLQYQMAPNWANEVASIRIVYELHENDSEVVSLSKDAWKTILKKKIRAKALLDLQLEASQQKQFQNLSPYNAFARQQYLDELPPNLSRKIFHIRTGTVDLRGVRRYMYDNADCRLCQAGEETVEHIVNECPKISRTVHVANIYTTDCEELRIIAKRCLEFDAKVDVD